MNRSISHFKADYPRSLIVNPISVDYLAARSHIKIAEMENTDRRLLKVVELHV